MRALAKDEPMPPLATMAGLAGVPHACPRCGYPAKNRDDYEHHRKRYHGAQVGHGVSYNGLTGTWRVEIDGTATYLTSEDEAWAYWRENKP